MAVAGGLQDSEVRPVSITGEGDAPLLECRGLSTSFGTVVANDDIHLTLRRGEVLGILGENGAGKSTFVRVLCGLQRPDSGDLSIKGERVRSLDPASARRHGVAMMHQHFSLCDGLSVMENVLLGVRRRGRTRRGDSLAESVSALSERYGLRLQMHRKAGELSVGERQRVELLKCLWAEPEILILDEPTAVLDPAEAETLYGVIAQMAAARQGIILISHKLDELFAVTSRIAVMRAGRVVSDRPTDEMSPAEAARLMLDEETFRTVLTRPRLGGSGDGGVGEGHAERHLGDPDVVRPPLLELRGVSLRRRDGPAGDDVSLVVPPGSIVGVAGVEGNGQSELAQIVAGSLRPTSGRVFMGGEDVTSLGPQERLGRGLGVVHEDRHVAGAALPMRLYENVYLNRLHDRAYTRWGFVRWGKLKAETARLLDDFGVGASVDASLASLSGGNQQRVVFAREVSRSPSVLLAAQPTRGLDIAASAHLKAELEAVRAGGGGVLLVSSELDDLIELADVIVVLHRASIVGVLTNEEIDHQRLAMLMAGQSS